MAVVYFALRMETLLQYDLFSTASNEAFVGTVGDKYWARVFHALLVFEVFRNFKLKSVGIWSRLGVFIKQY